ncbi:MAG: (2Fe-2S)-binding protein [Acidimicrobiales bacterium]
MYVCLCRAVSNTTIEAAIRAGANTVELVSEQCGASSQCGKCRHTIEIMLTGLAAPVRKNALNAQRRSRR